MQISFFLGVAIVVTALLVAQERRRRAMSKAEIIEAPVAQRRLIVSALIVGMAVFFAFFAAMAVQIEAWGGAAGFGGVALLFAGVFFFTRKPKALLRLEPTQLLDGTTRIDLAQPFVLHSALKHGLVPVNQLRGTPWMVVSVLQDTQAISFCFPWTVHELNATPSEETRELPVLMLDWRGSLIFERLRKLASAR